MQSSLPLRQLQEYYRRAALRDLRAVRLLPFFAVDLREALRDLFLAIIISLLIVGLLFVY